MKKEREINWLGLGINIAWILLGAGAAWAGNEMRESVLNLSNYQKYLETYGVELTEALIGSGKDFGYMAIGVGMLGLIKNVIRSFEGAADFFIIGTSALLSIVELQELGDPALQDRCERMGDGCGSGLDLLVWAPYCLYYLGKYMHKWGKGPSIGG